MKKAFLRNLIIILVFLGSLVTVVTLAYAYISNKVLQENIGDNLTSIISTTSYSMTHDLETSYLKFDDAITTLTEGIQDENKISQINKKLEVLNQKKDLILFPENIPSGFGGFLEKDGKYVYYIDGIYYQDVNANYVDLDSEDNITIFNFGNSSECKVEGNNVTQFEDAPYIIYKFDDIIVYAKAEAFFNKLITKSDLLEFQNLLIVFPDGKVTYSHNKKSNYTLYEALRNEFNADGVISDIHTLLNQENGALKLVDK